MSSVDSFMWHPQSMPIALHEGAMVLTMNDTHIITQCNGTSGSTAQEMGLSAQIPPRVALVSSSIPRGWVLTDIMNRWADENNLTALHSNHAIVDIAEKGIYVMDGLFESDETGVCMVLFYYSIKRGGKQLEVMQAYATKILQICEKQMGFYPNAAVVCIYGVAPRAARTWTYYVHTDNVE